MSTKGVVDIVFCIDASASMKPCFDKMQEGIIRFLEGLESDRQMTWDWRLEFIAHQADESHDGDIVFINQSIHNDSASDSIYGNEQGNFFTTNLQIFKSKLAEIEVFGDEAPLVALDICLDLPWRSEAGCHRVVIFLTDEPFETTTFKAEQQMQMAAIIQKIQDLRVILFIIAPDSEGYDYLSSVDKAQYHTLTDTADGMRNLDLSKLLAYIGKSVSVMKGQDYKTKVVQKGLFGQKDWQDGGNSDWSGR